ncbi:outer membrane protein transport protein [soil metagenome]
MKRIVLYVIVWVATGLTAFAQNPTEILRYSQLRPGGTARGLGVGGAFGALGADYTGIGINPGGLGVFRRSDVSLGLGFQYTSSETDLSGNVSESSRFRANLPNASIVISRLHVDGRGNRRKGNWIATNFAFGFNRLANFNARSVFTNSQSSNSLLNHYRDELQAGGLTEDNINYDNFSTGSVLAYNSYLLNPVGAAGTDYVAVTDGNLVNQQMSLTRRGGIDEMSFAMGANYNDKFYFGMLIGIPFLSYDENLSARESDDADVIPAFNTYSFTQTLKARGTGINAKMGFVVRAAKWMRLGASFHTPTRYKMTENYYTEIVSNIDTLPNNKNFSSGDFAYKLSTPWRAIASAAFLVKTYGFLSVDYEYSNFNMAKYNFGSFESAENALNKDVKNYLRPIHTIRAGGEVALKHWRLRAGFAHSTSPLEKAQVVDGRDLASNTYSGGAGYKGERWYIDLAYYRTTTNGTATISPYIQAAEKLKFDNYVMTVGFNF